MDTRLALSVVIWSILFAIAVCAYFLQSDSTGNPGQKSSASKLSGTFIVFLAVALVVWRWRSLNYAGEINVDESQILAQALRYKNDALPWRSVDGSTGGPLYTWALFWAPLLGLKLDYFAARLTGIACYMATLTALVLCFRKVAGARHALLLAIPAVTFSLTTLNFDYVFFSSEQLPMAVMAWASFLIIVRSRKDSGTHAYLLGLLTGSLPFCKIQAGPAAVWLWLAGAAIPYLQSGATDRKALIRLWLLQALGGITVPLLILSPVIAAGAWRDFWDLYIVTGASYQVSTAGGGSQSVLANASVLLFGIPDFQVLVIGSVIATLWLLYRTPPQWNTVSRPRALAAFALITFFAISVYSIARSGYNFPHYSQLALVPLCLLPLLPAILWELNETPRNRSLSILATAICAGLIAAPQCLQTYQSYKKQPALLGNWGEGVPPIGNFLRNLCGQNDSILVWGYAPKWCVFSGLTPATRFSSTVPFVHAVRDPTTLNGRNFERFLEDFAKSKPFLFVDAPDEFWFPDPSTPRGPLSRHHINPVMAKIIRESYIPVTQIPYPEPQRVPILVYKRKPE
jgi:hypothetical protein